MHQILPGWFRYKKGVGRGKMSNIYSPNMARVVEIRNETADVKSFRFEFIDPDVYKNFTWKAGQFLILSVFGVGEATFTFANPQTRKQFVECSIRKVGLVTEAIHEVEKHYLKQFKGGRVECLEDRHGNIWGLTIKVEDKTDGKP